MLEGFKNMFYATHSFILMTLETPQTIVFVLRLRAEAAKRVFSYRGMLCGMALKANLKMSEISTLSNSL